MSAVGELVSTLAAQGVTKAVTVRQPYASLIVAGVKEWETRPYPFGGLVEGVRALPGLKVEPGERIAIHAAGSLAPGIHSDSLVGPWEVQEYTDDVWRMHDTTAPKQRVVYPLQLGAIVGTVEVGEALPIYAAESLVDEGLRVAWEPHISVDQGSLAVWRKSATAPVWGLSDIADQLPYGWWTPGDWAVRLESPERIGPAACPGALGVWALERAMKATA